jgi:hypothetical protein
MEDARGGIVGALACFAPIRSCRHNSHTATTGNRGGPSRDSSCSIAICAGQLHNHNNGYDYADLYTEDGTFGGGLKGREALARAAGRTEDGMCKPIRLRGAMNQLHINVAPIIEPDPAGGRGISYLMMVDGPANEIYWNGWYQDVYAKTAKGWRFKSRNHVGGARAGVPAELSSARPLRRGADAARQPDLVGKIAPGAQVPVGGDHSFGWRAASRAPPGTGRAGRNNANGGARIRAAVTSRSLAL